ncbi:MAG: hypothetical protein WBN40_04160 [Pseudomonadales bacterium]
MSQALTKQLDAVKSSRYIDSSLESLAVELSAIQKLIIESLDAESEELGDVAEFETAEADKLASRLQEIAGALGMLELTDASRLVEHLKIAVTKIGSNPEPATVRQRQAVFEAGYLLARYVDYVRNLRARNGEEPPLILAPCFYMLASAGLAPFVDESELARAKITLAVSSDATEDFIVAGEVPDAAAVSSGDCSPNYNPAQQHNYKQKAALSENQSTFRRLRKMYQVALIGLLRDTSCAEQLKLIDRVANRSAGLVSEPILQTAWQALSVLVSQIKDGKLQMTGQRKHFFARFDRWLRDMSRGHYIEFHERNNFNSLRELIFLLMLSGSQRYAFSAFDSIAEIGAIKWRDEQIESQRRAVESGLRDSVGAMGEAIREILAQMKQRLSAISESDSCDAEDVAFLADNMATISAVLRFCDFNSPALSMGAAAEQVHCWIDEPPHESELLQVADAILSVENTLRFSAMGGADDDAASGSGSLEQGLVEQAHQHLFTEMQANIALSARALGNYLESNFDREHIANIGNSLAGAIGGFQMVGLSEAAELTALCGKRISEEHESREPADIQRLESIADCLVSIEYLLHELAAGRKSDSAMKQLISENLAALHG